jgi:spore germination protein (amino acid permease)
MSNTTGIGIIPAFSLMILTVGLMNHVLVIPPLLEVARRDAWLSIIVITLPYLLWCCLLYLIMKKTQQVPIITWLQQHFGSGAAWAVRVYFILYLFMIAAITLKETTTWTKVSYLNRTPLLFLASTLLIVCYFAARWGFRAITISSGILLPFVILFGDFVMSANLPKKNYSLLLPILENGWTPVLHSAVFILGGLAEIIIILLFQHKLKSRVRLDVWLFLGLFLIVLIIGPVTGAIAEFGPFEAADLRYPAYEEWRLVSIGKYIQHVDFLSIYQWLSGAVIRIALSIFLITDLLPLRTIHTRNWTLLGVTIMLLLIAILPISDIMYLQFMKNIYFPISLFASLLMTLIIVILLMVNKRRSAAGNKGTI